MKKSISDLKGESGIIKLLVIIILGIAFLSYLGIDSNAVADSVIFQTISKLFISFWN